MKQEVRMNAIRALAILGELCFSDTRTSDVQNGRLKHLGATRSTVMKLEVCLCTIRALAILGELSLQHHHKGKSVIRHRF